MIVQGVVRPGVILSVDEGSRRATVELKGGEVLSNVDLSDVELMEEAPRAVCACVCVCAFACNCWGASLHVWRAGCFVSVLAP